MSGLEHETIIRRLDARHQQTNFGVPRWIFLPNLRIETGFGKTAQHSPQTIDAWAMDTWPAGGYQLITYEVKVSRADFQAELRKPHKRAAGLALSTHFYFVVPAGLVKPDEIPEETGLIYVHDRSIRTVKKAPQREFPTATWDFLAAAGRALIRQTGMIAKAEGRE